MKITFLGTNGWYTDEKGNTPCILIDSPERYIIFDAGNGFYKLDQYITDDKPVSLFISHFHIDHVSGLHTLSKFNFPNGLDIYVGPGRKMDFETLVNTPFTVGFTKDDQNIHQQNMPVRLEELPTGKTEAPGFPVETIELHHGYRDHGYRVEIEGKIIAYSGDCGINEMSLELARDADVLIHECSFFEPNPDDNWGHVDATQAATLARDSGVKKLLLTHFDPMQYKSLGDRRIAEGKARTIFPQSFVMHDNDTVDL